MNNIVLSKQYPETYFSKYLKAITLLKNLKKTYIPGIALIVLSWIFWGLIVVEPA